jgi:VanZ family protein
MRLSYSPPFLDAWLITQTIRAAAWLVLLAIVVLSLVPPWARPVTAPQTVEHLTIFLLTGLAFGLGYPRRQFSEAVLLLGFTGAIELAQLWVPGRHARLSDFLIDALGLCIGIGIAAMLTRLRWVRTLIDAA